MISDILFGFYIFNFISHVLIKEAVKKVKNDNFLDMFC